MSTSRSRKKREYLYVFKFLHRKLWYYFGCIILQKIKNTYETSLNNRLFILSEKTLRLAQSAYSYISSIHSNPPILPEANSKNIEYSYISNTRFLT